MSDATRTDLPIVLPLAGDGRAAAQLAERERALDRQRALDSTAEAAAAPAERIRRWERLHALNLPSTPGHPLLAVIAARTRLTLHEVIAEQQRRVLPALSRSDRNP